MSGIDGFLESIFPNFEPQSRLVVSILVGVIAVLLLVMLYSTRRNRKKTPIPEKIEPFKTEENFSLEGLERFNLNVSEPSELVLVEKDADLEKPKVDYENKYTNLEKRYMNLGIEFSSVKGRLDHWKQRCLRAEEINEGYGSDVSAIYKSKGDIKVSALEYLLAIVADTNSIEQGIRTINKPPYPKSVQIGSTVVACLVIAFFWLNKEAWANLMLFINTPRNQIFIAVALVALAIITYYYRKKR